MKLHRYIGNRKIGQSPVRVFGSDQSRTKTYNFNSLGFRGEEYNPKAKRRIFVCGCSHTIGTGLNLEETWPYLFKLLYSHHFNLNSSEVNLLNFADGGASNDYISRTVLSQCTAIRPDLLLVLFTYNNRTEYCNGKHIRPLGPWIFADSEPSRYLPPNTLQDYLEAAKQYYEYYSDESGFISTTKNILLLQFLCKANNIDSVFGIVNYDQIALQNYSHNEVCSTLQELIEWSFFVKFSIHGPDIEVDKAADGTHPGPRSHQIIADRFFNAYIDIYCD